MARKTKTSDNSSTPRDPAALRAGAPQIPTLPWYAGMTLSGWIALIVLFGEMALILGGFASFLLPIASGASLGSVVPGIVRIAVTVGAPLVVVIVAFARFHEQPWAFIRFNLFLTLVGCFVFGAGTLHFVNQRWDDSTPKLVRLPVLVKEITYGSGRSSRGDSYPVVNTLAWQGGGSVEFLLEVPVWERVRVGDSLEVRLHDGALGISWADVVGIVPVGAAAPLTGAAASEPVPVPVPVPAPTPVPASVATPLPTGVPATP